MRRIGRWVSPVVVAGALALAVLPGCGLVSNPPGDFALTADFSRGTGLYPGSPVRVLGINVGRITKVTNRDRHVVVKMRLDDGTKLPDGVTATIVPLTLLGERYVQLGPAYTHGPRLRSGATIPQSRTAVPTEFDDLLRGLQDYVGSIDPKRAGDVVTNLSDILDGRGNQLNGLISNASGTLDLLADKGSELHDIINSLADLSETLRGRTRNIENLIRNYDLVAEVLVENKDDLDATITQFDRAARELTDLLVRHEQPLQDDVAVLTQAGRTVGRNTENLKLTLHATVNLFEAAGRAYDKRMNSLDANNQAAADVTSAIVAGRLRDRIAGLCRRLSIDVCSNPASALLNDLAGQLPGILGALSSGQAPKAPSAPKSSAPTKSTTPPPPKAPSQTDLLAALASQLTDHLAPDQAKLLGGLDAAKLTALLGLDPALLQVLPKLDAAQLERVRLAKDEDLPRLMLDLTNEVNPPASRLEPLLPGGTTTTTKPKTGGLSGIGNPVTQVLGGMLGGV
jgi:phospholipid/cholesterol/gamma-HCH transport system substrate-binding protein